MFGSFFCNVENFFFISLAVIFILVMLLVYLFKRRISNVEQTGNTMFDMVRRLTDEVKWLRCSKADDNNLATETKSIELNKTKDIIEYEVVELPKKIVVEDLVESESEYDSVSLADSDDDSASESDLEDDLSIEELHEDVDTDVKPLNIEDDDTHVEMQEHILDVVDIQEPVSEPVQEPIPEEIEIMVDSLDDEPTTKESTEDPHYTVDDLKKMDIKQLRHLASVKSGQDTSKTKKNELIRMLTVSVSLD
jgi:hypothetical protein